MAEAFSTPRNFFKFIRFTPTTKKIVCVLCGNKIEKSDNRRKLFHGSTKTEICLLFEKHLNITISEDTHTDTSCKKCVHKVKKVEETIKTLKEQYGSTIEKLYKSHGKVSQTSKRQYVDDPSTSSKKALFHSEKSDETFEDDFICLDNTIEDDSLTSIQEQFMKALKANDIDNVRKLVQNIEGIHESMITYALFIIQEEIKYLALRTTNSILRRTSENDLKAFSVQNVLSEWHEKAPTFLQMLKACVTNKSQERNKHKKGDALLPGLVTAGAKLLSIHNQELNLYQYLNSLVLWKGGLKKSAFTRLSTTYDSFSYQAVLNIIDKLGLSWNTELLKWQDENINASTIETSLMSTVHTLQQTIDILENNSDNRTGLILQLANAEHELDTFRSQMPPRFYFIGDNVDMTTKVRHMTLSNQNKGHHMFQICAYQNRVNGNHLQNERPKMDPGNAPLNVLMPSEDEEEKMKDEFAYFVSKIWSEYLPYFNAYRGVLPKHLEHQYMREMNKKRKGYAKKINMGVLMKNEQYNEDMTDICEFIHQFVPGHDNSDDWIKTPLKTLSGGDYLTFERHKQAQNSKRNGRTPTKRMEGLVPKMEEFHNQGEVLKVIWQLLYSTGSANDGGTLFSSRNIINARNVTKDPSDNFYASSDLIEKTTIAYILTGAMKYFGMSKLESSPTTNLLEGPLGDSKHMKEYIMFHARKYVDTTTSLKVPKLPNYGPQSNNFICRYCGKNYKQAAAMRRHEALVHGHPDPLYDKTKPTSDEPADSVDCVQSYTILIQTLGLLRMNHNDAIHMGDGDRIMRVNTILCLYYKVTGCTKYAFGILETLAQSKILLTDRLAHRLIWNRTVNHQGDSNTNHPNDLDLEHCNKIFKDQALSYRGVITEKTVARVSKGAFKVHNIVKNYDKQSQAIISSGKHTPANLENDIRALVRQYKNCNLFDFVPGRKHSAFKKIKCNPLMTLDIKKHQNWISSSLKKFSKKHFY